MYFYLSDTHRPSIPIPTSGDVIAYSSAKQYNGRLRFRGISVKLVLEGEEKYFINGEKIILKKNQYLLANHLSEGFVDIDYKHAVVGICADVGLDTIAAIAHDEYSFFSDRVLQSIDRFIHSMNTSVQVRELDDSNVSLFLKQCAKQLELDPISDRLMSREFYFELGRAILEDHVGGESKDLKLRKRMRITEIEIKRLCEAKSYMDDHFTSPFLIKDVALMFGMSEFRFFRLFKQVFDESPYRYLLVKRLWYSCYILHRNKMSVTQAAFEAGFADIHTFSKAYKRFFSISPNQNKLLID